MPVFESRNPKPDAATTTTVVLNINVETLIAARDTAGLSL